MTLRTFRILRFSIGLLLAAVSVSGFASTFIVGAALTKSASVSPEVLACLRFVIASAVMAVPLLASSHERARLRGITRRDVVSILWLGPVGTSLMAWFVFLGCARVSTANASMADALTPIMIFLASFAKTRRAHVSELCALACGLAGASLVIQIVTLDGIALTAYSMGDVYIMLAAATWAVYTVYGHESIAHLGAGLFTCLTMAAGAAALGIFLPFLELSWPATPQAWGLVFVLGFVSTLLPFWTWNEAQKFLPMSVLGICAYFTPVVAILLGIVFLGESVTPLQWLGTAFVVLSGVLAVGPSATARRHVR